MQEVTGIQVDSNSTEELQQRASNEFRKAWDYGFVWNILIHNQVLDKCRTRMGHASYATDGTDYSAEIFCPFEDPEDAIDFQPMEVYGRQEQSVSWALSISRKYG